MSIQIPNNNIFSVGLENNPELAEELQNKANLYLEFYELLSDNGIDKETFESTIYPHLGAPYIKPEYFFDSIVFLDLSIEKVKDILLLTKNTILKRTSTKQ